MKTIAIANQKGGVGKTASAFFLSHLFSGDNKKTLLVDIDPQGNLTTCFLKEAPVEHNIRTLFQGKVPTPLQINKNLFLVGADITLSKYEADLKLENFYKLKTLVEKQAAEITIIDCPPSLGLFTSNALLAADYILAPCDASEFSLMGLKDLFETVEKIKVNAKTDLKVLGVFMCAVQERANLFKAIRDRLQTDYRGLFFETVIPASVRVGESLRLKKPLFDLHPDHKVSAAYKNLYKEIKERMGKP